jgi:hypothetical protein
MGICAFWCIDNGTNHYCDFVAIGCHLIIEVNMSRKKITGLVLLIIGVILIAYSMNARSRIAAAKSGIHELTSPFSGSSAGQSIGDVMEGKASQYDTTVMLMLIGGIALVVIGGCTFFLGKKRR